MTGIERVAAWILVSLLVCLWSCAGANRADEQPNGNAGTLNDNGSDDQQSGSEPGEDGIPRNENSSASESGAVVVPRSVGGGVEEAETFAVDRETTQLSDLLERRDGARQALEFLNGVRRRFRRVLNIARRIENAPLRDLSGSERNAELTLITPDGDEICVRLSTEPFAVEADGGLVGGALPDSDLISRPLALRIWVNRECTDRAQDYRRFYASIIEARPEDVNLDAGDDSSDSAWRAGRGRSWTRPGALLDVDPGYGASAEWDHLDPAARRTVFHERGPLGPLIDIAAARYVVTREQSVNREGHEVICKRVHATIEFDVHPTLSEIDIRLGLCFMEGEEGRQVERLLAQGRFCLNDADSCVMLDAGCIRAQDGAEEPQTCDAWSDPELLDLDDSVLVDEPPSEEAVQLPDDSFNDTPPSDVVTLD